MKSFYYILISSVFSLSLFVILTPVTHASGERGDTFAEFFDNQPKKVKTCIRKKFSSKQLNKWINNPNATLKLSEVNKVAKCVGHPIIY